jgi:PAS domain S-box-containing protein
MSNVEEFPLSASRQPTEFDALVAPGDAALDAIPGAVYLCDADGWLVAFNSEAARLWGRTPDIAKKERYCGSHQLYLLDGTPLAHHDCPMATAVRLGTPTRNAEVIMARPDGSRFTALVNIRVLRDHSGRIQGAINCFQDVTGRKQVEEEVCRKTQDLEDFFENGAVGLHIVSGRDHPSRQQSRTGYVAVQTRGVYRPPCCGVSCRRSDYWRYPSTPVMRRAA